jgi:hypothetical protein
MAALAEVLVLVALFAIVVALWWVRPGLGKGKDDKEPPLL